jgi:hypothetical protein
MARSIWGPNVGSPPLSGAKPPHPGVRCAGATSRWDVGSRQWVSGRPWPTGHWLVGFGQWSGWLTPESEKAIKGTSLGRNFRKEELVQIFLPFVSWKLGIPQKHSTRAPTALVAWKSTNCSYQSIGFQGGTQCQAAAGNAQQIQPIPDHHRAWGLGDQNGIWLLLWMPIAKGFCCFSADDSRPMMWHGVSSCSRHCQRLPAAGDGTKPDCRRALAGGCRRPAEAWHLCSPSPVFVALVRMVGSTECSG